jgi:hypothetical protein
VIAHSFTIFTKLSWVLFLKQNCSVRLLVVASPDKIKFKSLPMLTNTLISLFFQVFSLWSFYSLCHECLSPSCLPAITPITTENLAHILAIWLAFKLLALPYNMKEWVPTLVLNLFIYHFIYYMSFFPSTWLWAP